MTTNSTKYFCKRGATSARLICVEASLSVEYRYDGEHGKYYFGARYFDPFFGMWMSPDPAAVFFRETYTPLKCRSIIEKDILQRSNGEAVLLKQSFRASAQFANPYSYGGDPLNYVDPNGEAVHILVGAIIGAVVGTVNGVIQCTSAGGGSCEKAIGVGFVGGAAVGAGAAATGGLAAGGATAVFGTGSAATVGSAVVGGAVGGAGNYVNQSIVNGGFNSGDLWESTWKGAAAGAVGGGAGEYFGNLRGALVGGFGGGAVGSALNKEDGWSILKSGIMGAAMGGISYAATVHVKANNDYSKNESERSMIAKETGFSIEGIDDLYNEQNSVDPRIGNADKQEFYIRDNDTKASAGRIIINEDGNYRNRIQNGVNRTMHGHGPLQKVRVPTPGDYIAAATDPSVDQYMLDTPSSTIYKYNGDGVNVNAGDYIANENASNIYKNCTNIEKTWSYKPYKSYSEYYKEYFSW